MAVGAPEPSYAASTSQRSAKHAALKKTTYKKRQVRAASKVENQFSALAVDADTGQVLYEKNAGATRYPASLTKMMTLYLTFDALKKGKLSMDKSLIVSAKAAGQPQTNISLEPNDRLPLRTAIESLVVRSANDSAMVLAETIGGTEFNFALMMTKKARELGMKNTVFRNPSGLPDTKQHTTALDMARLGIALRRDFPEYYSFFSLQNFEHRGVTYTGHNHVMKRYAGVDGLKTGYIRASGFNLVTSAKRDGRRVVAVIMGGKTIASRDNQMIALLDRTFDRLSSGSNDIAANEDEDSKKNGELEVNNAMPMPLAQGGAY